MKRGLVLSGGGALGAYEAGVLRFIFSEIPRRIGRPVGFDIATGTSVGALHACYLGATAHLGAERGVALDELWRGMSLDEVVDVSLRSALKVPSKLLRLSRRSPDQLDGMLDTTPLRRLLERFVPWPQLQTNLARRKLAAVCVSATDLAAGHTHVFIESADAEIGDWAPNPMIIPRRTRLGPEHAMASTAVPFVFPPVRVDDRYYVDGGVRLNTPLVPAIRLGADRILVIALRQEVEADAASAVHAPSSVLGALLSAVLLDHLESDLGRMRFVNSLIDRSEEVFGADYLEKLNQAARANGAQELRRVQELVLRPSADPAAIASDVLPRALKTRPQSSTLRRLIDVLRIDEAARASEGLSIMLFDSEFTCALADLGYRDAQERADELEAFFAD